MKKLKQCFVAVVSALLAVGVIPQQIKADESVRENERRVFAQEVDTDSALSTDNLRKKDDVGTVYKDDEIVTAIVQFTAPAVMDYYDASMYAIDGGSAGESVAAYLGSDEAREAEQQLKEEQQGVIDQILSLGGNEEISTMSLDAESPVVAQWSTLVNGMAVKVPYGTLDEINALDGVKRAYVEHEYDVPEDIKTADGETPWYAYSYDKVDAQEAWKAGYTGQGMLVAVLDTGIDITWGDAYDSDGNMTMGVTRCHEAFMDDSFMHDPYADEGGWNLRYDYDSMKEFLADTQLNSTTGADGGLITWDNNALYKNRKVPYACDYADGDVNVQPGTNDHGVHVSGTVAGYAETEEGEVVFSGVAPDAQLMMMKVFSDQDGGAMESVIVNALEDSLKLGADVINLSLGADNGFSEDDTLQNEVYGTLEEAGIVMMTSAGNSGYSSVNNNYEGNPLTSNVDTTMMSSPAIYDSNVSVASLENAIQVESYFTWNDADGTAHEAEFVDPWSGTFKARFADGTTYPVYLVDGYGSWNDYNNVGWYNEYSNPNGKTGIALVKRGGEISFADKVKNGAMFTMTDYRTGEKKGVIGVLVYDEDPNGTELVNMSVEGTTLECAFVSGQDGAVLENALKDGQEVNISVSADDKASDSATDGQMSSFSSWGAGPSLELKPEITAPGGNIWSAVVDQLYDGEDSYTGSYAMMSGTSMAAPHMSGMAALVRERVQKEEAFASVAAEDISDVVSQLLVSTAIPVTDTRGVYYSPRSQGAGLANVYDALTTPAYITVDGETVGKLEFKDDPEKTGTYNIAFNVHNVSDTDVTYDVNLTLMRPDTTTVSSAWGDRSTMLHQDVVLKTVSLGTVTATAGSVTVFNQTVSLTAEEKAALDSMFSNGVYVEGFVSLKDTSGQNATLGLPMLSYYGDWTKAPIFDASSWIDEPQDGSDVTKNEVTWGVNRLGSASANPSTGEILGYMDLAQNPFDPSAVTEQTVYHKENITISPNGDEYLDRIDDYILYQLRDAKAIVVRVTDAETGEVYFSDWTSYIIRTLYNSSVGAPMPMSAMAYGLIPVWDGTDKEGNVLPSGTKCNYEIIAYGDGDYGDKVYEETTGLDVTDFDALADGTLTPTFNGHALDMTGDSLSFPVTVDTVAPKLENHAVSIYEEDGHTYIEGTVYDEDGSISAIEILPYVTRTYTEQAGGDPEYSEVGVDRNNPFLQEYIYDAETKTYSFKADITSYTHTNESYPGENWTYNFEWNGNVMINLGDYGANERSYAITAVSGEGLVLSQTSALLHPGSTFDLSVIDNTGTDGVITRTSSNPEVATIDETGKIIAIAPGQTIITVAKEGYEAHCVVAVEAYNTEVEDFDLVPSSFDGLNTDGQIVVKVENLKPRDVQLNQIEWKVYEDEYYLQYAEGLLTVQQYTDDGLSGAIYMNVSSSTEQLPAGTGYLEVTLNGVTRRMELSWDEVYQTEEEDGLVSAVNMSDQVLYTTPGTPVTLLASYRNKALHETGDVVTELNGLTLEGPDFFYIGGKYEGRLVPLEGYTLPEEIHLYTRYTDGSQIEMVNYPWYKSYTYDSQTGEINVLYGPTGADNKLLIKADGVPTEGAEAGVVTHSEYERPNALYGPFEWTVKDGNGSLVESTTQVSGQDVPCVLFTPEGTGESTIVATDGNDSLTFKVVSEGVLPTSIDLPEEQHRLNLRTGDTFTLNPVLDPVPTAEEDKALTYTSFNPEVATVDENGVITAVSEGMAYIKISSSVDNRVATYCVVEVTQRPYVVEFVDYNGDVLKRVEVEPGKGVEAPVAPEREGYTFTGWDKAFDVVNEDMTVTAQYAINRYTVSFVADGNIVSSIEKEYGQVLTDADYPSVPEKKGYTGAWKKNDQPVMGDLTIEAEYTKISEVVPGTGDSPAGDNKPADGSQDTGIAGVVSDIATGNYASVLPYAIVLVVAVAAAGVVIVMKKKKKQQ